MDVALVIIFVVVFYILPIIFKSKNPKKYEYPDVPRRVPVPAIPQLEIPNLKIQGAQHADVEQVALPNSATDLEVTSELVSEPIDAWQGLVQ
ncbi:MAG: hypothetical protein H6Q74_1541 [Firmicutes bacterium]|nr:hypothetical protein [Bacillota bacterium]